MADGTRMRQRRATKSQWDTSNYVLADGELGVEKDTGVIKIGNGTTPWTSLPAAFGSTYLPVLGKAADSERLDGISSEGFVQIGDTSALPTASKVALRNSAGRLKAVNGVDSDDLTTLQQLTAATLLAKQEAYARFLSAAFNLQANDANGFVVVSNSAGPNTVMNVGLPANADVPFPIGTWIDVCSSNNGTLLIVPDTAKGVVLRGDGRVYGGYGTVRILKIATNEWVVVDRNDPPGAYATCTARMVNPVSGWGAGWKHLPLNGEDFDSHNGHLTGVITGEDTNTGSALTNRYTIQPGQYGRYRVGGGMIMTVGQSAAINVRVVKNGAEIPFGGGVQSNSSVSGAVVTGDKILDLVVGDYVSIMGYCSVANWNTVLYSDASTHMGVQRIS